MAFEMVWEIVLEMFFAHMAQFFQNETFLIFVTIFITGIIAAEARLALEILHLHNKFNLHTLNAEIKNIVLKGNFRKQRYLIGIVTAFIAIISLARPLDSLNQAVIGFIAALSGNVFLIKQIDGDLETSLADMVQRHSNQALSDLEDSLNEDEYGSHGDAEEDENRAVSRESIDGEGSVSESDRQTDSNESDDRENAESAS